MTDNASSSNGLSEAPTAQDVGAQQIAKVYAKAFMAVADGVGKIDEAVDQFDSLVVDVLNRFPGLEQLFASDLSADDKTAIVHRVLGQQASPLFLNFLKVLANHGRLDVLKPIQREVHKLYDQLRNRIRVRVTTAQPLDDAHRNQITDQLRAMLGGEPMLEVRTDPDLLGGVVLHVGDTVYDGSVATRLQRVRQQMINRSVHEIQSRRDRFSYSEGN